MAVITKVLITEQSTKKICLDLEINKISIMDNRAAITLKGSNLYTEARQLIPRNIIYQIKVMDINEDGSSVTKMEGTGFFYSYNYVYVYDSSSDKLIVTDNTVLFELLK